VAPSATTIPVAPAAAQVQAALLGQLAPRDPTLSVAIGLSTRNGYRLPLDSPVAGRLTIDWYQGSHPLLPADRTGLRLVARGSATIRAAGPGAVSIKPTAHGRKLLERSRRITLTAVAGLAPEQSLAVSAVRVFTLR
jgi:hypothetical protein